MKINNILFICIITTNLLYSQGAFLDKGQKGFEVSGGFFTGSRDGYSRSGFGISAGYSFNGIYDVGLFFKTSSIDDPDDDSESLFSPNLSMHIVKQSESVPLALSFNIGYVTGSINEDYSEYYTNINIQGYTIKGVIFKTFEIKPSLSIKPFFSFGYYSLTERLKNKHVNFKDNVSKTNPSIGVEFVFSLKNLNIFVISSSLTIDKDFIGNYNSLSIIISYILPKR